MAHELLVGAANPTKERSLRRGLLEPFRTRQRLHVPARQTWEMAAQIDHRLRRRTNLKSRLQSRSFANDILLAASARELGAVIVTENSADFSILASVLDIRFAEPQQALEIRRPGGRTFSAKLFTAHCSILNCHFTAVPSLACCLGRAKVGGYRHALRIRAGSRCPDTDK